MAGRKAHTPSAEQRKSVEAMSAYGIPQEDIASVIGLDSKTLRKYYSEELAVAKAKANAKVAERYGSYSSFSKRSTTLES